MIYLEKLEHGGKNYLESNTSSPFLLACKLYLQLQMLKVEPPKQLKQEIQITCTNISKQ